MVARSFVVVATLVLAVAAGLVAREALQARVEHSESAGAAEAMSHLQLPAGLARAPSRACAPEPARLCLRTAMSPQDAVPLVARAFGDRAAPAASCAVDAPGDPRDCIVVGTIEDAPVTARLAPRLAPGPTRRFAGSIISLVIGP